MKKVTVIGAGLAGSEAAYQLAKRGIQVKLYEMKPKKYTEVHQNENFAELVCSNSFGADRLGNASGMMKEEMRRLDSLLMKIADETKVPAGQALAVDRESFAKKVTEELQKMENVEIINEELKKIPRDEYVIVATGPLSSDSISEDIKELLGENYLYFYDAVAPILTFESIDKDKVYFASRYDKGEGEYINCPMNKEQYDNFYNELLNAESIPLKKFEQEKLFEACMPVEKIAGRGEKTLLFGPLKPKGLVNPRTEEEDYAVIQLRQDDTAGSLYNMVGFQTNLKWGEQKRVFSMIPGLENAEFVRYGVMHRNTFINSTKLLNKDLSLKMNNKIHFAGQITGSEGYMCAIATGCMAAINVYNKINGLEEFVLDSRSSTGAIINYITEPRKKFQPMGPNFGIMDKLDERVRDKRERYERIAKKGLEYFDEKIKEMEINK
ncbi:MAG: methylenetetrahydrofolate--tRNA-(uracil(54)-C(5))-methyltransferase (FADH(2)-oxidizing) TrmFO [Fusobacteriia bacterium 4572_132]|nr:MAG: methylenetetrahydrofolate--tRNA-(uracil(54)-C(5))-methyltransferase (FADH(2)-oxidizing) TrmFO [Fusobacteriia bacterium 4572_132]